jgi:hypothetical protein
LWKWIKRSTLGVLYAEKAAFFVRKICAFFRLFEKKFSFYTFLVIGFKPGNSPGMGEDK